MALSRRRIAPAGYRYRLLHRRCRTVVAYYDHPPVAGELIASPHAVLPDGTRPFPGWVIWCPRCGVPCRANEDIGTVRP